MANFERFFVFYFFFTGVFSIKERCEDDNKYCKIWASMKLCENPQYLFFMKQRCRKSCNLCSNKQRLCSDYDSFCNLYSSKGYCKALHVDYMRLNCCMSCKFAELKQMAVSGICGTSSQLNSFLSKHLSAYTTGETKSSSFNLPWAAYIFTNKTNNIHSTGLLISKTHVLTTASSVYKFTKNREIYAEFGGNQEKVKIKIKKILIHPSYNKTTNVGDIALLTLETKVNFSSNIRPICLPTSDESERKKKVFLGRRIDNEDNFYINTCLEDSKNFTSSTFNLNCENLKDRRNDCQIKNGFQMIKFQERHYLIGLIAWDFDCNKTNTSWDYIRVFNYIKWIVQHSGE